MQTEHVPRVGWRVSQQNYIKLGKQDQLEHDTQNLFVILTMTTPDGGRYRPHEVLAAINALPLEQKIILNNIRINKQQWGHGNMPTTLYPEGVYGQRRAERDRIAVACLALRSALKK